ncbi:hypothetical protein [Actinokineospora cianjurensis]|uniref:hypothetical protein n=1 Tax=Actinokineospora cianjurensis TaxID=585224 RepID=UPI0011C355A1|nr:hypothetical protein [Actinokineospora cianjurensis]
MYRATGLTRDSVENLFAAIHHQVGDGRPAHSTAPLPGYRNLSKVVTMTFKEHNFRHNKIRVAVERAIAQLKTWPIPHTDYRRPYNTFAATITTVTGP